MSTSPVRATIAVLAGLVLCWTPVAVFLVQRYWGAFGVFSRDDWLDLWPEFFGRYLDGVIGLIAALGFWALARRIPRTIVAATIVGGLGSYLGLQFYVVTYLLLSQPEVFLETFRLSSITGPSHRIVSSALTGAILGATMFLIAYRRK